jgi:hypothetical protein
LAKKSPDLVKKSPDLVKKSSDLVNELPALFKNRLKLRPSK